MRRLIIVLGVLFSLFAQGAAHAGKEITISTSLGTQMNAYIAGSDEADKAVLLLHDRWGLNDHMRQLADRFANRGYQALAIDVFDGRASNDYEFATEIMNSVDPEWIKADVVAGLKYLRLHGRKVFAVGSGLGGWQAFQGLVAKPDLVDGVVVFYGELTDSIELARTLNTPILGIFAMKDLKVTPAMVQSYEYALRKSLTPYRIYSVDADHGFIDPQYRSYNKELADDAWIKAESFLNSIDG